MTPHTDAVILLGGRGRQLQPLTLTAPPMVPPTGVPLPAQATARCHPAETTILRPPWLAGRCCSTARRWPVALQCVARSSTRMRRSATAPSWTRPAAAIARSLFKEPSRGPVRGRGQMC